MSEVTQILLQIEQGNSTAAERLLPLVYDELRKLAAAKLAQEKPGQTLQATALVHEAYLRLVGTADSQRFENRQHFFVVAAEAMRRILVDKARRKNRHRHGGQLERVELDDEYLAVLSKPDELLAVDETIDELAEFDAQAAQLVKLHCFVGLTIDEAAEILQISPRTAYRNWAFARAWLFRSLKEGRADGR